VPRSLFVAAPSRLRRFEPIFASATRVRGIEYAARGLVRIAHHADGAVLAEVQGQERYTVELRAAAGVLRASCSCPHFLKGEACKHLWATLMVAERDRILPKAEELRLTGLGAAADA
jgi:uncharacterized Zn finger protein